MLTDPKNPHGRPPDDLPKLEPAPASRPRHRTDFEVIEIDLANKSQRKKFIEMTEHIYEGDKNFVMPLRSHSMKFLDVGNNKSLKHFEIKAFIAVHRNKIVGRICAHIDHAYNRYHGHDETGWFGFFECVNERKIAHGLMSDACNWLRSKGCTTVIGPMNFSTNHQCGLLVENFERPPVIEMTYNPRYYEELLLSFGFSKAKDLFAWTIDVTASDVDKKIERIKRVAARVKTRNNVSVRTAELSKFENEVRTLFEIYNRSWQKNWGFVPVAEDEFSQIAADLRPILEEKLILFVEVNAKPVGFSVTLPDINQALPKDGRLFPFGWLTFLLKRRSIDFARLMVLGIDPDYRKKGLETLLFLETIEATRKLGMKGGELGWTLEDNELINNAIRQMNGKLDRKYRLFGGDLS